MANKYLAMAAGLIKEVEALVTSSGASDAGKLIALDSSGKIDESVLPTGIGAETKTLPASEALSAGDFINFWDDSGTLKVRKADASTTGKQADGFVLAAVDTDANATVYTAGINNQLTSLTGGPVMFLSASTAGDATATAPGASGNVVQQVGIRLSATEIAFEPSRPVELA